MIGVDFDNTIVTYDEVFHRAARDAGLIPADLPATKSHVRNHLRGQDREAEWTALQGTVYGVAIRNASAFPGVREFFRDMVGQGWRILIVSHKTQYPYAGPKHDLHAAARDWLERQGFFDRDQVGLPKGAVFLETTLAGKLSRIGKCGCTHFIDDLPEVLGHAEFPAPVTPVLFDPGNAFPRSPHARLTGWQNARKVLNLCPTPH